MRLFLNFFLILLISIPAYSQRLEMKYKKDKRTYIIHLPEGYDKGKSYPLVLNFHALFMGPTMQKNYTMMNCVADKEKFIVVYPKGKGRTWNTGIGVKKFENGKDDLGFANALLDSLIKTYSVDTTRVYAVGMSMGGFFSYRLACQMSHRIAAVASVAGLMSDSTIAYCETSSMPVLQIHGTKDHIVKYKTGLRKSLGAEETVEFWVNKNNCMATPDTTFLADTCKKDKSHALLIKYPNCDNNSEVWFYKIENGGHTWPLGSMYMIFMGKTNDDFYGSLAIWDFLKKFSLNTDELNTNAQRPN